MNNQDNQNVPIEAQDDTHVAESDSTVNSVFTDNYELADVNSPGASLESDFLKIATIFRTEKEIIIESDRQVALQLSAKISINSDDFSTAVQEENIATDRELSPILESNNDKTDERDPLLTPGPSEKLIIEDIKLEGDCISQIKIEELVKSRIETTIKDDFNENTTGNVPQFNKGPQRGNESFIENLDTRLDTLEYNTIPKLNTQNNIEMNVIVDKLNKQKQAHSENGAKTENDEIVQNATDCLESDSQVLMSKKNSGKMIDVVGDSTKEERTLFGISQSSLRETERKIEKEDAVENTTECTESESPIISNARNNGETPDTVDDTNEEERIISGISQSSLRETEPKIEKEEVAENATECEESDSKVLSNERNNGETTDTVGDSSEEERTLFGISQSSLRETEPKIGKEDAVENTTECAESGSPAISNERNNGETHDIVDDSNEEERSLLEIPQSSLKEIEAKTEKQDAVERTTERVESGSPKLSNERDNGKTNDAVGCSNMEERAHSKICRSSLREVDAKTKEVDVVDDPTESQFRQSSSPYLKNKEDVLIETKVADPILTTGVPEHAASPNEKEQQGCTYDKAEAILAESRQNNGDKKVKHQNPELEDLEKNTDQKQVHSGLGNENYRSLKVTRQDVEKTGFVKDNVNRIETISFQQAHSPFEEGKIKTEISLEQNDDQKMQPIESNVTNILEPQKIDYQAKNNDGESTDLSTKTTEMTAEPSPISIFTIHHGIPEIENKANSNNQYFNDETIGNLKVVKMTGLEVGNSSEPPLFNGNINEGITKMENGYSSPATKAIDSEVDKRMDKNDGYVKGQPSSSFEGVEPQQTILENKQDGIQNMDFYLEPEKTENNAMQKKDNSADFSKVSADNFTLTCKKEEEYSKSPGTAYNETKQQPKYSAISRKPEAIASKSARSEKEQLKIKTWEKALPVDSIVLISPKLVQSVSNKDQGTIPAIGEEGNKEQIRSISFNNNDLHVSKNNAREITEISGETDPEDGKTGSFNKAIDSDNSLLLPFENSLEEGRSTLLLPVTTKESNKRSMLMDMEHLKGCERDDKLNKLQLEEGIEKTTEPLNYSGTVHEAPTTDNSSFKKPINEDNNEIPKGGTSKDISISKSTPREENKNKSKNACFNKKGADRSRTHDRSGDAVETPITMEDTSDTTMNILSEYSPNTAQILEENVDQETSKSVMLELQSDSDNKEDFQTISPMNPVIQNFKESEKKLGEEMSNGNERESKVLSSKVPFEKDDNSFATEAQTELYEEEAEQIAKNNDVQVSSENLTNFETYKNMSSDFKNLVRTAVDNIEDGTKYGIKLNENLNPLNIVAKEGQETQILSEQTAQRLDNPVETGSSTMFSVDSFQTVTEIKETMELGLPSENAEDSYKESQNECDQKSCHIKDFPNYGNVNDIIAAKTIRTVEERAMDLNLSSKTLNQVEVLQQKVGIGGKSEVKELVNDHNGANESPKMTVEHTDGDSIVTSISDDSPEVPVLEDAEIQDSVTKTEMRESFGANEIGSEVRTQPLNQLLCCDNSDNNESIYKTEKSPIENFIQFEAFKKLEAINKMMNCMAGTENAILDPELDTNKTYESDSKDNISAYQNNKSPVKPLIFIVSPDVSFLETTDTYESQNESRNSNYNFEEDDSYSAPVGTNSDDDQDMSQNCVMPIALLITPEYFSYAGGI